MKRRKSYLFGQGARIMFTKGCQKLSPPPASNVDRSVSQGATIEKEAGEKEGRENGVEGREGRREGKINKPHFHP